MAAATVGAVADAEVHSNINNTQTVGILNPIKAILNSISGEE